MKEIMERQETEPQKERSVEIHNLEDYDGNPIAVMTKMEVVKVRSGNFTMPVIKDIEIKNEKGEWNPYPSIIKKDNILYCFTTENGEVFLDKLPAYGEHKRIVDEDLIPAAREAGIFVEEIE